MSDLVVRGLTMLDDPPPDEAFRALHEKSGLTLISINPTCRARL